MLYSGLFLLDFTHLWMYEIMTHVSKPNKPTNSIDNKIMRVFEFL